MNIYIVIIALLLGGVTFLGFQVVQAPEEEVVLDTEVIQQEESSATTHKKDAVIEEQNPAVPAVTGKTINLSGMNLSKVPEYVFDTKSVVTLDVSNNNLDGALQAEVRQLQNLQVLDLSNNNFTGLPAEIGQLQKLEILNLSNNPITGLPLELGNLKNLKVLDLRGTQYSAYDLERIRNSLSSRVDIKI